MSELEDKVVENTGVLTVGSLIDVLKEFPKETPVFFVSSQPEFQFEVSCEYFNDFIEIDGEKKSSVVFLYRPTEQQENTFEVEQPELDFEE